MTEPAPENHAPSGGGPGRWARYALLGLLAVALAEVVGLAAQPGRVPREEDWSSLEAWLKKQVTPGDLVVAAPAWIDPVARQHLGDLVNGDDPARLLGSTVGFRRLVVVGLRGHHALESRGRDLPLQSQQSFGALEGRVHALPATEIVADVAGQLDSARVTLQRGSSVTACDRRIGDRWSCQGSQWNAVGPDLQEIGFRTHRCVWAHPVENAVKRIEWEAFPLGERLEGGAGLSDPFARSENEGRAELTAIVDGKVAGRVTVGPNDGMLYFDWPTPPSSGAARRSGRLVLEVRAQKTAYKRQLCFVARSVASGGAR
jgi:hypothetical protein